MSLQDVLDETKKQLSEALEAEEQEAEEEQVEEAEEKTDEPEKEAEEKEAEEKPAEEVKLDDAGYARLRREAAANKKLAEERAEENARLKREMAEAEPEQVQEAEAPVVAPEILEIVEQRRMQKAGQEFTALEESFRKRAPEDFDGVTEAYKLGLYQSIRIQNPRMTHEQLVEQTNKTLLIKAGTYMNAGYDPIEEMYEEAKALGFKAAPKKEAEQEEERELKPNLKKVAANRARNAGTAAAKGAAGQPAHTRNTAAGLTLKEWSLLPPHEKQRLLKGG